MHLSAGNCVQVHVVGRWVWCVEACLQQAGELGVPVGSVPTSGVHKSTDNVPQGAQGQVDLGRLLQPIPTSPCLALPLTASQVHQIQLPNTHMPASLHHSQHCSSFITLGVLWLCCNFMDCSIVIECWLFTVQS